MTADGSLMDAEDVGGQEGVLRIEIGDASLATGDKAHGNVMQNNRPAEKSKDQYIGMFNFRRTERFVRSSKSSYSVAVKTDTGSCILTFQLM